MPDTEWDMIARREFEMLDSDWQKDWADLRQRVAKRR